jgi:hypothetical protein
MSYLELIKMSDEERIEFYTNNPDKTDWVWLSKQSKAIGILEQNPNKIFIPSLCENTAAIKLIEQFIVEKPSEILWECLSMNPAAFEILKRHPENVDLEFLLSWGSSYDEVVDFILEHFYDFHYPPELLDTITNPRILEFIQSPEFIEYFNNKQQLHHKEMVISNLNNVKERIQRITDSIEIYLK